MEPTYSIVIPAYNESVRLAASLEKVLAYVHAEGWNAEVIVVNDGSTDETLDVLTREFQLLRTDLVYVQEVPCQPVRGIYMNQTEPRLLVVDKEAGGSKADASLDARRRLPKPPC